LIGNFWQERLAWEIIKRNPLDGDLMGVGIGWKMWLASWLELTSKDEAEFVQITILVVCLWWKVFSDE